MKKIFFILAILLCSLWTNKVVRADAITIGGATGSEAYFAYGYTGVTKNNPANGTGNITSVQAYAISGYNLANCEMATFYVVSGDNLSTRGNVTIGTVTGGSVQTFDISATPMAVNTGDYLGITFTSGRLYYKSSGGPGKWGLVGDQIPSTNVTFGVQAGQDLYIYGTGATVAVGNSPVILRPGAVFKNGVIFK